MSVSDRRVRACAPNGRDGRVSGPLDRNGFLRPSRGCAHGENLRIGVSKQASNEVGRSPLAATLARACAEDEVVRIRLGRPAGGGWYAPAELAEPSSPALDLLIDRSQARFGGDRRAAAALFFHMYVWNVAAGAIYSYLRERRVPDVGAGNVLAGFDEHAEAQGVALLAPRFAALADDAYAEHADAVVVRDEAELRVWLHERVTGDNADAVAGALGARGILGRPILRGIVSDTCADIFVRAGRRSPTPEPARDAGNAFLGRFDGPESQRAGLFVREHAGRRRLASWRATCCLVYRTPEGTYCDNCPLLPAEERELRLLAGFER